ncbi:MAG TPA: hypothetical protein PLN52_24400 [Opitutaceae bacterium]|nr:hypothetical protein [Opitutaceae bacterium]
MAAEDLAIATAKVYEWEALNERSHQLIVAGREVPQDTRRRMYELWPAMPHPRRSALQRVGDCHFLDLQYRDGELRLFAAIDLRIPMMKRKVKIISTGGEFIAEHWDYIGSTFSGKRVWHALLSQGSAI